jgi:hypothetical protein
MQREGAWGNVFLVDGVGDQLLSQLPALAMRDQPADDIRIEP